MNAIFVGTGDLFAASLLVWLDKDRDLKVRASNENCCESWFKGFDRLKIFEHLKWKLFGGGLKW